jgi:hypothetical protein
LPNIVATLQIFQPNIKAKYCAKIFRQQQNIEIFRKQIIAPNIAPTLEDIGAKNIAANINQLLPKYCAILKQHYNIAKYWCRRFSAHYKYFSNIADCW